MINLETERKTMKKLKLYGKKEEGESLKLIAAIYVDKDKKVMVEAEDPKVKEDLEREITEATGEEGVPTGKGSATISVTDKGELVVEAQDPEMEEFLRKETKVEKTPEGYYLIREGKRAGNLIQLTYIRPSRMPEDFNYLEALRGYLWRFEKDIQFGKYELYRQIIEENN